MLAYVFSSVFVLAPLLQAVFDLSLQLAFQQAVLLVCLAWLFLEVRRSGGPPAGFGSKRLYPLWGAAAMSLLSLVLSPFRGQIFNEWGNYAAGLLIFVFAGFLGKEERETADRAVTAGAWLLFALSLLQAFVLKNFDSRPPLTNLNALALYAVMLIPLALQRRNWFLAAAMVILMAWTQSLGAALAALAAVGFYAADRLRRRQLRENALLFGALAALACLVIYQLQADSVAGRLTWWKSAWDMFLARPLAGFGCASYTWAQAGFQPAGAFREHAIYAHNYYLEFLSENGLPAALCWFWLLFSAVRSRAGLVKYSLIAALAHSFVDFGLSVPAVFWLFCYLLSTPAAGGEPVRVPRRALAAALVFALLLEAALVSLDRRSLAFESALGRALADARAGNSAAAETELKPELASRLFREPALEFLGRLNLSAGDGGVKAAEYFEMALLENRYSAASWNELERIYSVPGRGIQAASLARRRAEAYQ
jgi:O-antigen ligase